MFNLVVSRIELRSYDAYTGQSQGLKVLVWSVFISYKYSDTLQTGHND